MDKKLENANTLGERLYILREDRKMSQDEMAEALNVSRQTISNWENDKVKLDVVKAAEICRLFDISMDELFLDRKSSVGEAQTQPKNSSAKTIVMLIALALSALLIVAGVVCLATSTSDEVSSTIFIGESAVWVAAILVGAVACGVLLYFFFKKRR